MSRITARDTLALEERGVVMERINALLQTLQQTSGEQRAAIESLATAAGAVMDPDGPSSGSNRVARGGSWYDDPQIARSAVRVSGDSTFRYFNYGFRLVKDTT